MTQEKRSFWSKIFGGSYRFGRQQEVLECIVYRIGEGAYLQDVVQEEYVRRNASAGEVRDIFENPRLVEAARQKPGVDLLLERSRPEIDIRSPATKARRAVAVRTLTDRAVEGGPSNEDQDGAGILGEAGRPCPRPVAVKL